MARDFLVNVVVINFINKSVCLTSQIYMLCCSDFCINVADISFINRFLRMLKYVYMSFTHMSNGAAWSGDGDWLMELDALGSALLR